VEVKFLRRLASKVVLACGNLLPHDEVLEAFRVRSERLISPDTLDAFLNQAENPAIKAERILFISDNIVGEANRRKLTGILLALLEAPAFNRFFSNSEKPASTRLRLLCELQNKVLKSELDTVRKQSIAADLDSICLSIVQQNNLLARVSDGQDSPVSKSLALLKLAASNILTRGKSRDLAQRLALGFIREPGALKDFLKDGSGAEDGGKLEELRSMLSEAGIDPETVLPRRAA